MSEEKKVKKNVPLKIREEIVRTFLSGEKTAQELSELYGVCTSTIYNWRVEHEEEAKGVRIKELIAEEDSKKSVEARLATELELKLAKEKIAEQAIAIDLLKKVSGRRTYQFESELTGLMRTIKKLDRKKGRAI